MQHRKIADASTDLVEKIKDTGAAKAAYDAAAATLVEAEEILHGAHAAEVEAHGALHSALTERKKARRSL